MVKIRTERYMEVPELGIELPLAGLPIPEDHEDLFVREADKSHVVSWLVHDESPYFEWDDIDADPGEWVKGVFRDFRNHYDGGGEEARDTFIADAVARFGQDRVFIVDVYSHGLEHFSRSHSRWYPDREWDVAPACVLIVPPDVTNPAEWADGILDEYSSWANGDTWAIVSVDVDAEGNRQMADVIGGFIGRQLAEEAAKSGDY